jgi:ElaB/YqjD/DUF883 family membrane-anchored ribosome-binding protein
MGQDPGKGGAVTTDELRTEIEQTRAELGETAAALGAKTDVKGRAKERVHEIKENVAAKTPPSAETVKENPVPAAAVGALLVGFALGWIMASRRHS